MSEQWLLIESTLRKVILPELDRGRLNWDRPHTEAVVYWAKQILENLPELNRKVIVTAAYAHDWGYIDLFPKGIDFAQIRRMKPKHMEVGAERIEQLLRQELAGEFSEEEITRVKHLVAVHDKLSKLKDEDEIVLMEADTLGALDGERVKPTFSLEDHRRYVEEVKKRRQPLFRHSVALAIFEKLLVSREEFYAQ